MKLALVKSEAQEHIIKRNPVRDEAHRVALVLTCSGSFSLRILFAHLALLVFYRIYTDMLIHDLPFDFAWTEQL